MGPMFVRVFYCEDGSVRKEDVMLMANTFAEAMDQIERYYSRDLVGVSMYGYEPNELIFCKNFDAMIDEAMGSLELH